MSGASLPSGAWRQIAWLTAGAAALLLALRWLPQAPPLTHMDFVAGGPGALEFCDPLNPKFLPVVARASPVTMTLESAAPLVAEATGAMTLLLRTVTGKPIGPGDLLPTAAQKINLLLVDPSLEDFQAFPPVSAGRPGAWRFAFTPRRSGTYRIFADFTPAATGQEMYASADVLVGPGAAAPESAVPEAATPEAAAQEAAPPEAAAPGPALPDRGRGFGPGETHSRPALISSPWVAERKGYRFVLTPSAQPIHARDPILLAFTAAGPNASPAALEPFDGGLASLVAFDQNRTGFVNLHARLGEGAPPAASAAPLVFPVAIPDPGRYVIWSRVKVGGQEVAAPFWFEVIP
jgi:hypothetical protein